MTLEHAKAVAAALHEERLENPVKLGEIFNNRKQKETVSVYMAHLLEFGLHLDLKDDSLRDTPKRFAKMYVDEIFCGLDYNNFPKITLVENKFGYHDDLIESGIQIYSTCEHHLLPIIGEATIAYRPREKVLGLSKLNRLAEFFSRRPQVQERLTMQIGKALSVILEHDDVFVKIKASHMCVKLRGVEDPCCDTTTFYRKGVYKNSDF